MPLYDYKCECGVVSERVVNQSDINNQECPKCGKIMYWDAHKKQKDEEGKITVPVTENIK